MTNMEKWNYIVHNYEKFKSSQEAKIQQSWEDMICPLFLNFDDKEIKSQDSVNMGTAKKADIVIQKGGNDVVVFELKQYSMPCAKGEGQLLSYLNQLKTVKLGVLVCDHLYVYDFDLNKKNEDNAKNKLEITFREGNPNGEKFIALFSKENFDIEKIREWIHRQLEEQAKNKARRKQMQSIREQLNEEIIRNALENYLSRNEDESLVKEALQNCQFYWKFPNSINSNMPSHLKTSEKIFKPTNAFSVQDDNIKKEYQNYLAKNGYALTTINNYCNAMKKVLQKENCSWEELKGIANEITPEYCAGGPKADLGKENNHAVLASLKQFRNFVNGE